MIRSTRRKLLSATAFLALTGSACARSVSDQMPWAQGEAYPISPLHPGPYLFFTPNEATAVDAIVDRLIPSDALGIGGREAGCTVFIDRQLAGPYGGHDWLYMQGPFPPDPLPSQGMQSPVTPRQQYRQGLAALASYCRANYAGRSFAELQSDEQDGLLGKMEKGDIALPSYSSKSLFSAIYANTIEGFFADPVYGGNKDMVGWKLVGFPGTRYDYRDVIEKPNQLYTMPPVSLTGRPGWDKAAAQ